MEIMELIVNEILEINRPHHAIGSLIETKAGLKGVCIGEEANLLHLVALSTKQDPNAFLIAVKEQVASEINSEIDDIHLDIHSHFTSSVDKVEKYISEISEPVVDNLLRAIGKATVRKYYQFKHSSKPFKPGETPVSCAGRVFNETDMESLFDANMDFWLTAGPINNQFQENLSKMLDSRFCLTVNSGSSANLLAFTALTSHKLRQDRLKVGDEVITVAAGFPTTINPIIMNGLIPVFVDIDIPTYNIKSDDIEAAITEKTRAIMVAHTLGNPFDLNTVMRLAKKYNLWVIEDCCDALGATYTLDESLVEKGQESTRHVGKFGNFGTLSFYPAHHITMGEGGAVFTDSSRLNKIVESFRDWGRDCWCEPGKDNTCLKRFTRQMGSLPVGYDHKYTYSHVGYNMKITDMQAAVGLSQLQHADKFIKTRNKNFKLIKDRLSDLQEYLVLPEATPNSNPSWFGFPILLKETVSRSREDILKELNEKKIGTRLLFGGNLTMQPYMKDVTFRTHGTLDNTNLVMRRLFWVGVYPGLSNEMIVFMTDAIRSAILNDND